MDTVRYVLWRWGFIGVFRVDNGHPFGDPTRQAISPLALHLQALGIRVHLNPARSPKRNAKVERTQGTTSRWADPATCADYLQFQERLSEAVIDQRERYPTRVCGGQTRASYFPDLFSNPQRFHPADFDMRRVFTSLAKGRWQRQVSANGIASMFGQIYQVGYAHRRKTVTVTFDPDRRQWVFYDDQVKRLAAIAASNITEDNLRRLSFNPATS